MKIAIRSDGETGLHRVHAEGLELTRHPHFLLERHRAAWRLLAVAQRSIEDGNSFHDPAPSVVAPRLLLETSRAYFARTPERYRGSGGRHRARRSRSASSETCNCRRRLFASMVIVSFSSTSAIVPPAAASGATWPTTIPCVPPEKRPSVINPTASPSPAPTSADVGASISRMPGPPFGPS